eukprot:2671580-Prymnesium_polylepis.1
MLRARVAGVCGCTVQSNARCPDVCRCTVRDSRGGFGMCFGGLWRGTRVRSTRESNFPPVPVDPAEHCGLVRTWPKPNA